MISCSSILLVQLVFITNTFAALPTLYEYYTSDGVTSGLSVDQSYFTLNGKNITILSGTMHYFRIPPQYWRDRLKKLRAAGLNTVETYVSWNLHEPKSGVYDFGDGGSDFQQFLNLTEYLTIAQEEDLFAIVRPGPYICAEWEWGGFPSWMLVEDQLDVRTSDPVYMQYVERYYNQLLPKLEPLQFTKGGPIIALQVENEYGNARNRDREYIQELYDIMRGAGLVELLLTSDESWNGNAGSLPDVLFQTVNFGNDPAGNFDALLEFQPGKPVMVMEYWTGMYDRWSLDHQSVPPENFEETYEGILSYPASGNLYMFHGGTNFGFMNGANIGNEGDNSGFLPVTTTYDYDAPLLEGGDYTEKYEIVRRLIQQYNPIEILTPEPPEIIERVQYPTVQITEKLNWNDLIGQIEGITLSTGGPISMEKLPNSQSYGYAIYRKRDLDIPANAILTIAGHIRDAVIILVNGKSLAEPLTTREQLNGFGYFNLENSTITLTDVDLTGATLEIFIENWGRVNAGGYYQVKGLIPENVVYMDGNELIRWEIQSLEFGTSWNKNLQNWVPVDEEVLGPTLYKGLLIVEGEPRDSFIDNRQWSKGIVIVNGFVLGRYAIIGPQQTLYLPGVFLNEGDNEILVFEHFKATTEITFSKDAIYEAH